MHEFHRPARFAALASSAALVAVLAGCSSSGSGTSPRRVELEAAGVHVFEGDSLLYDVRQVFATDAGDVWVLSGLEPYVYRFEASGWLAARFGRQGKGPGELLNPWSLVSPPGARDGIGVWDISARRIVGYDPRGRPTTVLPVPVRGGTVRGDVRDVTYGEPFRLRAAGAEMVLQLPAGSVSHTRDLYGSMLVRVGRDGMPGDTLLRFRSLVPREGVPAARSLIPIPLWTTCPNGRVAVFDPHSGSVQWYQGSGMAERVRLPIERRPLTDDDIRPYLAQMLELEMRGTESRVPDPDEVVNAMLARAREQFGKEAPPAVEMLCDPRAAYGSTPSPPPTIHSGTAAGGTCGKESTSPALSVSRRVSGPCRSPAAGHSAPGPMRTESSIRRRSRYRPRSDRCLGSLHA